MKGEEFLHRVAASSAAILLFMYVDKDILAAIIIAATVHELAHIITIYVFGLKIKGIQAELSGLRIDYVGLASTRQNVIIATAGPLVGIMYGVLFIKMDSPLNVEFIHLSAQLSLIYSAFNLLPLMPLDGGRILSELSALYFGQNRGEKITVFFSCVVSVMLTMLGLVMMLRGEGGALFAAGVWLLILQS